MCQPGQIVVGLGSSPKSLFSFRKTPDIAIAPSSPASALASAPGPAPMYAGGWGLGGAGPSTSASPFQSFRARLEDVPVCNIVPTGLGMQDLVDIKWLIDGSHANLFIANYRPPSSSSSYAAAAAGAEAEAEAAPLVKVVVKMLKKESMDKSVARKEFEMEVGILSRVSSPHVVKLLGVGASPRPFMVLEWLSKGTLSALLSQNLSVSDFFRRPVFPKRVLYTHILNLAECLRYLHEDVGGPGSQTCIVHRGEPCMGVCVCLFQHFSHLVSFSLFISLSLSFRYQA
jgi:serine/threonine protein kinase